MVSMALRDTCRQNKAHTLTPCLPATYLLSLGLCQEPHTRAARIHINPGHFWDVPSLLLQQTQTGPFVSSALS